MDVKEGQGSCTGASEKRTFQAEGLVLAETFRGQRTRSGAGVLGGTALAKLRLRLDPEVGDVRVSPHPWSGPAVICVRCLVYSSQSTCTSLWLGNPWHCTQSSNRTIGLSDGKLRPKRRTPLSRGSPLECSGNGTEAQVFTSLNWGRETRKERKRGVGEEEMGEGAGEEYTAARLYRRFLSPTGHLHSISASVID